MLTPTIPERANFLKECKASVKAQTFPHWEHLVLADMDGSGCSATVNELASEAHGEWFVPLADDDLLLPGFLATLLPHIYEAEVVHSPPLVWGEDAAQFCGEAPIIPATCMIKADLWRSLGGYAERDGTEDMDFNIRAMERSARFVRIDGTPTWVYRFHGGNKSRRGND